MFQQFVGFVVAVCDLYIHFVSYMINNERKSETYKEWKDVFLNDTCDAVGVAWEFMARKKNCNFVSNKIIVLFGTVQPLF